MIKVYKTEIGIILEYQGQCFESRYTDWDELINRNELYKHLLDEIKGLNPAGNADWLQAQKILAPIGSQEVWAAGVTYLRIKVARMEESE